MGLKILNIIFPLLLFLCGFSWFFHILTPEKYHYLSDKQISSISGILAGIGFWMIIKIIFGSEE